jgi:hypothetical protein
MSSFVLHKIESSSPCLCLTNLTMDGSSETKKDNLDTSYPETKIY